MDVKSLIIRMTLRVCRLLSKIGTGLEESYLLAVRRLGVVTVRGTERDSNGPLPAVMKFENYRDKVLAAVLKLAKDNDGYFTFSRISIKADATGREEKGTWPGQMKEEEKNPAYGRHRIS